jgi:ribosomal-protein-alanine acetyltransferase
MSPNGTIRPLRPDDLRAVAEILLESPGAASWSRAGHEELVTQTGVVALVSEVNSAIIGFIIARHAADEAEILNLAVAPESRRAGHGSALLRAVLKAFRHQKVSRALLEVRESNSPAIAFYHKHGFVPTGGRKAYYTNPQEDALVMSKKLTT